MKTKLSSVYSFFSRPFTENFIFLVIISFLVCGPRGWYHIFMHHDSLKILLWETLHCYLLCYFVALLAIVIPLRYRKDYLIFWCFLAFLDFCIEIACLITTNAPFFANHIAIIMGTNPIEVSEFISAYFSYKLVIVILLAVLMVSLLYRQKDSISFMGRSLSIIACVITLLTAIVFIAKGSRSWSCKFYCKVSAFITYENPPMLSQYRKELKINYLSQNIPTKVVVILGESFARSHSSLYGYSKNTNPILASLVSDSLCVVYQNVSSPATSTIPSIKSVMSTYKQSYGESINWYECETLINIMSSSGYHTTWISNQAPSGVYDNVASRYADLCDTVFWTRSKHVGAYNQPYDGEVLNIIHENKEYLLRDGKQCVFIHLMGSHWDYSDRYPKEWDIFSIEQYKGLTEKQKKVIPFYDNSVLYNDYIVSEILNTFYEDEAVAFYFSDHGTDIFESSENYCGYGIVDNKRSMEIAKSIPFIVYMSPSYQQNYPNKKQYIVDHANLQMNTENFIEYLCGVMDISYSEVSEE